MGTRFLPSEEASVDGVWKRTILQSESEDVVKFEAWEGIFPPAGGWRLRGGTACAAYALRRRVMGTHPGGAEGSRAAAGSGVLGDKRAHHP